MARGRMIDKSIRKSKKLRALKSDKHRLLYFMIYPHVDVEGRFSADPEEIKIECVPFLPYTKQQIGLAIIDLDDVGLINLYIINNKPYLEITRFSDFNKVRKDKESESSIPPYSGNRTGVVQEYARISYINIKVKLSNIKEGKKEEKKIHFDFNKAEFLNIAEKDLRTWKKAYPKIDIKIELNKMISWLIADPKRLKSNYMRFINGWLSRTQSQDKPQLKVGKDTKKYTDKEKEEQEKFLKFHKECREKAVKKYQDKMDIAKKANDKDAYDDVMNLIQNETSRLVNEGF